MSVTGVTSESAFGWGFIRHDPLSGEQEAGADVGLNGEGQLEIRGEDAHVCGVAGIGGRQD